ncbi:MAG: O-antigen ligase family protein [Parcubacteria group bacterium]|jgi:O-antigen ligase
MTTLLIILAIYLPFQLALNPSEGIDLASIRVFILLIFFLWLAEGFRKKRLNIASNSITYLLVVFLFLSAFSFFWAKNQDFAMRKILFLLSIFPLYFVASDVIYDKEKMIKIVTLLVVSGTLAAAVGIVQFFSQFVFGLERVYKLWADFVAMPFLGSSAGKAVLENPSWLVNISGRTFLRATSTFPDPHMLALYLGMLIPLSAGLFLKTRKTFYLVAFLIMLMADVLTFSRGGYLGLLVGGIFLLIVFWRKMARKYKFFILGFAVLIAIAFIAPGPISSRFSSIFNLQEGSNVGRLDMWQKSWKVAVSHPILGVGIGNYSLEIKPNADYREPITAHNTYLDIAAETGIITALVWIALLTSAIIIFLKKSRYDNFYLMMAVSLVIFAGHQIAETAIYSPVVLTLFVIIISFVNVRENEKIS